MQELLSGYFNSLAQHRKALVFMKENHLLWYFVFPFLFSIILFFVGIGIVGSFSSESLIWIEEQLKSWGLIFDSDGWIHAILYGIIWVVLRLFYFILFAYVGGYVVLILLSPILSLLSAKVAEKSGEEQEPFRVKQFINDIFRAVAISSRNFLIELVCIVVFFFLSLIPLLGIVSPFALFFISAYYYGFSIADYNLERRKLSMDESTRYARKNKGWMMGIGTPFAIVLLIPVFGSFLAGFVAVMATAAGTLEYMKRNN